MSNLQAVKKYYDQLAPAYDADRFGGSYGQFLHHLEISILENWLAEAPAQDALELGCGTGRFSRFAKTGVDFSSVMLAVARKNYPANEYFEADIRKTGLPAGKFKAIICLHVLMHLNKFLFPEIWQEAHRILAPGGLFIFDIPSSERRDVVGHVQRGWHGATALFAPEIAELNSRCFSQEKTAGVLLFPIHHFPQKWRNNFLSIDSFLGKTSLGRWSSYRFHCLRKI